MKLKTGTAICDIILKQELSAVTVSHRLPGNPALIIKYPQENKGAARKTKAIDPKQISIGRPVTGKGKKAACILTSQQKGISNIRHTNTIVVLLELLLKNHH
jgi:hypothetical protein